MNEAQADKWRKTRLMGKAKYVMYYGVVTWGLMLTLFFYGNRVALATVAHRLMVDNPSRGV